MENPTSNNESNKYKIVANLQQEAKTDSDQSSEEDISVKAFKQKDGNQSERKPPWWERKEEI